MHPIYPVPGRVVPQDGTLILWRRHPLEYRPYQYEGYRPAERQSLRTTDIRMRVIRLGP